MIFDSAKKSLAQLRKERAEELRRETLSKIDKAMIETKANRSKYLAKFNVAKDRARAAIASNNINAKNNALNEMKFAYGFYHYMGVLEQAYESIQSQMSIQELSEEFAATVNRLDKMRAIKGTRAINFEDITNSALKNFRYSDTVGIDKMIAKLQEGSRISTNVEDSFFMDVINGKASIDDYQPNAAPMVPVVATSGATAASESISLNDFDI